MRSHLENGTVSSTGRAPSPEALENVWDTISPCFASNEGGCFKENMNVNKFETPKLAVEPLQMKKKRKGGGFNLRKSLAWDRAFFTEEGVLDPQELSFISGASCEEGLSFVNEHTPVGSQLRNKSVGIQKLGNSIFKKLQTEGLDKDIKTDGSSQVLTFDSSSSNSISSSVTSHKVPTLVGCKISGSRCGDIPRPLSSASLKRPANVNVGRTPGKESKQLKIPCLKPGLSPISAATKKTIPRVNLVKRNQTTQQGLKNSCESLKKTENASKPLQSAVYSDGNSCKNLLTYEDGYAVVSTFLHCDQQFRGCQPGADTKYVSPVAEPLFLRNLQGNSSYRRHSSINMHAVLVDKSNNSVSNTITPVRPVYVSEGRHEISTFATPLSQNPHLSIRNMQPSQNQVLKPSGLRMPSPSLSFFSQPKPPKPLVFGDSSLRGTGTDVCSTLKHENSGSKAYLRKSELDNRLISSEDTSTRSVCSTSSHVSAVTSIKPTTKLAPILKIQDYSEKNRIEKASHRGVAELQRINNEVPSQSEAQEKVPNEFLLKSDSDGYPENHQSWKSRWRNSELQSEHGCAIQEPQTISAINESSEEKNSFGLLFLNHGMIVGTQNENSAGQGLQDSLKNQSDGEDPCKSNCHGPQSSDTENIKNPLGLTHKHKNSCRSRGREQLNVSQQHGSRCSQSGEALVCKISKSVDSYLGSKDLHEDLYKEASGVGVLDGNLLAGQYVCNSNIDERENNINLISEAGDDANQTGKSSVVNITYPEAGQKLQVCQEDQNIEKLTFASTYRKDGSNAIGTEMTSSSSTDKGHDCNLDQNKIVGQTLSSTHSDSVDSSVPFSWCGKHEVSRENNPGKVAEPGSVIHNDSTNNQLTLSASVKENECDIGNLFNVQNSGTELVQTPESSTLNESCFKQSDYLNAPCAKFGAKSIGPGDVGLYLENCLETKTLETKTPANEHHKERELWSQETTILEQSNVNLTIFESPLTASKEKSLKRGICNSTCETYDESHSGDTSTDLERVCSLRSRISSELPDNNCSLSSCIYPKLDDVELEATLAPEEMHGHADPSEKSCSSTLPQNVIPFSDEWFTAIEAAGEDILAMKSGAVQNSPPDKPLPEPSPWSPVKKRNNQIGPFDCTKFNNNLPSDSI